jgi:hypothetical protein
MESVEVLDEAINFSKEPLAHRACLDCYPVFYPGMQALCGWILEGIPLTESHDKCFVCEDLKEVHFENCPGGNK